MELLGTQEIETERLLLRKFTINDSEDMYNNWAKYNECFEYLPWEPSDSLNDVKERINKWLTMYNDNLFYQWGIEFKKNKEIIGFINLHNIDIDNLSAETTYILSPLHWNKGIMTEAVKAVIEYGFEKLDLNRISADLFSGNNGSQKVMIKNGMKYEGTSRERYIKNGNCYDSIQYAILKKDWKQIKH